MDETREYENSSRKSAEILDEFNVRGVSLQQFAELVDACEAFGHEGGDHGATGEAFAGEGFVGESEFVHFALERDCVDARHLAFADGFYRTYRIH